MKTIRNRIKAIAVASTLAVVLSSCASVADMAGYNSATLNQESAANYTEAMNAARGARVLDTTSPTARRVQRIFNRMEPYATAANKTSVKFDWQMNVLRSDEMIAWAIPGGKMAVYTGLVEKLKLTDEEIAFIVGHEMTHALEEHSKAKMGSQVLTNAAWKFGGQALQAKTGMSSGDFEMAKNLAQTYGFDKPYSRQHEYSSDEGGLLLMAKAGYDPEKALDVWNKMNQFNDNNNAVSGFLSTHPTNNARTEAMRKVVEKEAKAIYLASEKAPVGSAASTKSSGSKKKVNKKRR